MVKHTQTELSVFDYFVGLAIKGLPSLWATTLKVTYDLILPVIT